MEERLRKFAELADAGTFTKAAARLHVSQPALSSAVAKLERDLKATLIVRGSRPLALTPAGRLAYQTAKDLAVQAANLKLRLAELSNEQLRLNIGMIDSVADTLFAASNGLAMLDGAKVSVMVNNSRYLTETVERGALDVAFVAEQSRRQSGLLETRAVGVEPLVLVAHASRPAPKGRKLPDFISYDQPSNTFRLVQRALRDFGVTPAPTFYSTSPEVMLRLVLLNKGIAALPYLMVRKHIAGGRLQRLGSTQWLIGRPVVMLKRRDRELPLALTELTQQTAVALRLLMDEAQFVA